MSYPLVRDLAAEPIPVRLTCGVLGHSRQAYYAWLTQPVGQRELQDAYLTNALIDAHADDPEFGYRFLADELERAGQQVAERRVWRLCSQQRLWSSTVRKGRRGSGKTPGPAVHDDLVQRDFTAQQPHQVWLTDITEHPTGQGKVYCCAIKDMFSNRIVGYAIDERMTAELAVSALRAAIARRHPNGVVVVHSDRGSQFRARSFRAVLTAAGLQGPWAEWHRPGTTPRWSRSSACSRRTSSTEADGPPATNFTTRSCSGSSTPTTVADDSAPWAG